MTGVKIVKLALFVTTFTAPKALHQILYCAVNLINAGSFRSQNAINPPAITKTQTALSSHNSSSLSIMTENTEWAAELGIITRGQNQKSAVKNPYFVHVHA